MNEDVKDIVITPEMEELNAMGKGVEGSDE